MYSVDLMCFLYKSDFLVSMPNSLLLYVLQFVMLYMTWRVSYFEEFCISFEDFNRVLLVLKGSNPWVLCPSIKKKKIEPLI